MIRRATLKKGVVALWCVAAAGCGRIADEAAIEAVPVASEATEPEAAGAAAHEVTATADSAAAVPPAEVASLDPPAAPAPVEPPPAQLEPQAADAPEAALAAPAARAVQEPEPVEAAVATPAADTLDVAALFTRLRKTKAINLRTKLAVKSESDDLMQRFRAYHAQNGTATLAELRRSYDSLFSKLQSLLEEADPPLARDIDRSRGTIWAMLADPSKFGEPAPLASTRNIPRS